MEYEAVMFDLDGVIVERTPSYVFNQSVKQAFATFDITNPREEDYKLLRQNVEDLPLHADQFEKQYGVSAAKLWEKRQEFNLWGQLEAIRNGEKQQYSDAEVIASLSQDLAVVSNNQTPAVKKVLAHYGLDTHFEVQYGIDPRLTELSRRKPNPEHIDRALTTLDADIALYIGDKESDVIAAENAGIDSAIVRREFNADRTFDTQPTYDLGSLNELTELV